MQHPVLGTGFESPHYHAGVGWGRVPPTLHLVMQAPPAPRVAVAGPESLQQGVVEQRCRYDEGSGASNPLQ